MCKLYEVKERREKKKFFFSFFYDLKLFKWQKLVKIYVYYVYLCTCIRERKGNNTNKKKGRRKKDGGAYLHKYLNKKRTKSFPVSSSSSSYSSFFFFALLCYRTTMRLNNSEDNFKTSPNPLILYNKYACTYIQNNSTYSICYIRQRGRTLFIYIFVCFCFMLLFSVCFVNSIYFATYVFICK